MKKTTYLIIISIFLLLIFIIYTFYKNEHFESNPIYCQSIDGTFIYTTDPKDSRCLKNINSKSKLSKPTGSGYCYTIDGSWGIYINNICQPINTNTKEQDDNQLSGSLLSGEEEPPFGDLSGMEDWEFYYEYDEYGNKVKRWRRKKKSKCEQNTNIPGSTPCFEFFSNLPDSNFTTCTTDQLDKIQSTLDSSSTPTLLNSLCQASKKSDNTLDYKSYGYYRPISCATDKTTNNVEATFECRKYYSPLLNDESKEDIYNYGTYQPQNYRKDLPLKADKTPNMSDSCVDKDLNLDTVCQEINENDRLYGVEKTLDLEDGGCYGNGTNKTRVFCSQKYSKTIPKLSTPYNTFTNCTNVDTIDNKQTFFDSECKTLYPLSDKAYDINSYDCPPNYFRAKCNIVLS